MENLLSCKQQVHRIEVLIKRQATLLFPALLTGLTYAYNVKLSRARVGIHRRRGRQQSAMRWRYGSTRSSAVGSARSSRQCCPHHPTPLRPTGRRPSSRCASPSPCRPLPNPDRRQPGPAQPTRRRRCCAAASALGAATSTAAWTSQWSARPSLHMAPLWVPCRRSCTALQPQAAEKWPRCCNEFLSQGILERIVLAYCFL